MSERRPTEPMLRELAESLRPVKPIPRLRSVAVVMLGVFGAALVAYWKLGGALPLGPAASLWSDPAFVAVLTGLTLTAAGALAAALSGAVPGRGATARIGRDLALGGSALVVGGAIGALALSPGEGTAMPVESSLRCLGRACAVGLLPALVVCVYQGWGVTRSPIRAAGLAALGAVGLGAAVVHAGCAYTDALHMFLGHALAPFAAVVIGSLPLALLVRARLGGNGQA